MPSIDCNPVPDILVTADEKHRQISAYIDQRGWQRLHHGNGVQGHDKCGGGICGIDRCTYLVQTMNF